MVFAVCVFGNLLLGGKFPELERRHGKRSLPHGNMVSDFLIRIKNASMAKNKWIEVRSTKQVVAVAEALKKLGFLDEVIIPKAGKKEKPVLKVSLAFKNKAPVIMNLKLVSKPGLRVYMDTKSLEERRSPSILLLSTPKGILSSKEALKARVGGEVLAEIL